MGIAGVVFCVFSHFSHPSTKLRRPLAHSIAIAIGIGISQHALASRLAYFWGWIKKTITPRTHVGQSPLATLAFCNPETFAVCRLVMGDIVLKNHQVGSQAGRRQLAQPVAKVTASPIASPLDVLS